MSQNPNITWKFVYENLDQTWNWFTLSHNRMCYDDYFISDQYRKKQLDQFWEASKEEFIVLTAVGV